MEKPKLHPWDFIIYEEPIPSILMPYGQLRFLDRSRESFPFHGLQDSTARLVLRNVTGTVDRSLQRHVAVAQPGRDRGQVFSEIGEPLWMIVDYSKTPEVKARNLRGQEVDLRGQRVYLSGPGTRVTIEGDVVWRR